MLFRVLIAALILASAATISQAGPFRRQARTAYRPARPPASQPVYQAPSATTPAEVVVASYSLSATATITGGGVSPTTPTIGIDGDGLDEVNAKRAARGLRPFVRDDGLTRAAKGCAEYRAANRLFGHTSNDFAFVPAGTVARSAGCAAYPASYGWMSCCVYDNYTYAGAAWVTGRDGRRYMHLFTR